MDLRDEFDLRVAIFERLTQLSNERGGMLTRAELLDFDVDGRPVALVDRNRGIRNPRDFASTLSVLSKPGSPYADEDVGATLFSYDYRGGAIDGGDNVKLRLSYQTQLPLILLRWMQVGPEIRYLPVFPVYTVADDPAQRRVVLALDETLRSVDDPLHLTDIERRYAQRITRSRLHQPLFRSRVLMAYASRCAICRLARPQLLEAAHIVADSRAHSTTDINNGLSMCRIHHTAYDRNLIGISPDYKVHIGDEIRSSNNEGPIMRYAMQDLNLTKLTLPKNSKHKPSRDGLPERFDEFLSGAPVPARLESVDLAWPRISVDVYDENG